MYQIGGWLHVLRKPPRAAEAGRARRVVPANVVFLGLTSLFTDISSEKFVAILPVYLVGFLRLSTAEFGLVDGLYQGIGGLMQLASAAMTDRFRRYKEMAAVGYVASAFCRAGLLVTVTWGNIALLLSIDRLGKGLRTAPRDALISLSVPADRLGLAFGVHRALDAVGAMLGPVVAFAILAWVPNGFSIVFAVSLGLAIVGLAVLGFFVENRPAPPLSSNAVLRSTDAGAWRFLRRPRFRFLALAMLLLSATTVSDAFVYLVLQRRVQLPIGGFPLLYVGTSLSYLLFAIPVGRLADRAGRFRVFIAGYASLLLLYGMLLASYEGWWLVVLTVALLGFYYSATEGVSMALGSSLVPEDMRTSGLAVLTTITSLARFLSSMTFGIVWSRSSVEVAITLFMAGLLLAILTSIAAWNRVRRGEIAV
jgi:MFS family permease